MPQASPKQITVRVLKYDGAEHRRWEATVQRREGSLLVLDATFAEEIQHDLIGVIARGTISTEYYWLDRWFNVFRFATPGGLLQSYYCNLNLPPVFDGQTLSYVDLDIDILVQPDGTFRVLDAEDFTSNAEKFGYPEEVRQNTKAALDQLITMIQVKAFPFNS